MTQSTNVENKNNPDGIIVLGVFIHCEGCGNEVRKCLHGYEGVEGIEINDKNHKVTVKGKKVDPIKVADRLRKKTGKHVDLISPKPKIEDKKNEKKPEPAAIEVVLKVYIHCDGCAKDVKHLIHDMEGVQTVHTDKAKNLVTVKGTMGPNELVQFINKRGGRHAEIVKQTNNNPKKEENCCYNYSSNLVYAPQLFSDENPNSCTLM